MLPHFCKYVMLWVPVAKTYSPEWDPLASILPQTPKRYIFVTLKFDSSVNQWRNDRFILNMIVPILGPYGPQRVILQPVTPVPSLDPTKLSWNILNMFNIVKCSVGSSLELTRIQFTTPTFENRRRPSMNNNCPIHIADADATKLDSFVTSVGVN